MAKGVSIPDLSAEDSLREAAVKILWTRFEEMWALRDAVLKGEDIEAVHDMRVASRRLRTLMQTFRPCFPKRSFREHYECIRALADELGAVRDRDVLMEELNGDVERLPEDDRAGVIGLVETLDAERTFHRKALRSRLKDLERSGYDRAFLTYLARYV